MFDEQITVVAGFSILLISIIVGSIAIVAIWSVPNQIVQNSGYAPLQSTYQTGKWMINNASDAQDAWNIIKAVLILAGLIGGGFLINFVRGLDFNW